MKILLFGLGGLALLVIAFVAWRYYATMAGQRRLQQTILGRIAPVTDALQQGRDPSVTDLERLAASRETRRMLLEALLSVGRADLLPARYRSWEAVAEGDLAFWLAHPNELAAFPDEMELMSKVPAPGGTGRREYFLFRFRTKPPHWAASDGWLAGVAGPYDTTATCVPGAEGTFSKLEPYESLSPEEHVRKIHELVGGRGIEGDAEQGDEPDNPQSIQR